MPVLPRHLPALERKAATVESVVALAAVNNPGEITTTAIAERMGLTQGALFKHFPTKDAILQAVMEWVAASMMALVEGATTGTRSPKASLEALFLAHVDFVSRHPGVPRIVLHELQRSKRTGPGSMGPARMVQTLLRTYSERVTGILKQGVESGEVDAGIDTEAAAILFVGTIQGLTIQSLLSGDPTRMRKDAPRVFTLYLRAIERRPS